MGECLSEGWDTIVSTCTQGRKKYCNPCLSIWWVFYVVYDAGCKMHEWTNVRHCVESGGGSDFSFLAIILSSGDGWCTWPHVSSHCRRWVATFWTCVSVYLHLLYDLADLAMKNIAEADHAGPAGSSFPASYSTRWSWVTSTLNRPVITARQTCSVVVNIKPLLG